MAFEEIGNSGGNLAEMAETALKGDPAFSASIRDIRPALLPSLRALHFVPQSVQHFEFC